MAVDETTNSYNGLSDTESGEGAGIIAMSIPFAHKEGSENLSFENTKSQLHPLA